MANQPEQSNATGAAVGRVSRWSVIGLLGALIVIVVLVGMRVYDRLQPLPPPVSRPLAVETLRLEPQPFIHSLRATGTLEAEHRVVLSAQLAARVESVPWREGARVSEGDVLVQLDESEQRQEVARLEAALDRVQTDLAFWRKQLESDRRLLDSQSISRRAFDETRRQVDSLEAALRETRESLQSARIRLDYAVVRAPFTGYVQTVHVLPGETVQPGMALLEVLAARPLKAIVPVPEADLASLREGQAARIRVAAVNESWPARIDRLYPGLERGTRSATLELFLPADTAGLRPGMAAEAAIEVARREEVLVIPQQALRQRQGGAGVFILAEGIAHWRPVRVGEAQHGRVEVISGVQPGDELIITPHPQLAQGRPAVARNDWRGSLQ